MRSISRPTLRVLDDDDVPAVLRFLGRSPVPNVFVASRVELAGADPFRLGAQLWGWPDSGELEALCYFGANMVPFAFNSGSDLEAALDAFAERAFRQGRRCSSIVGDAHLAMALWQRLLPRWGPAREVRDCQPLLVIDRPSTIPPDPAVRRVRPDEIDVVLPACVAMFTEEVGISPLADGGSTYRNRVHDLVSSGRAFARIEGDRVMFKAEVGAATARACQVQGVWVDPQLRGQGLSEGGMAAVVELCLRDIAPAVSLYVNDFNEAARRSYERVGFDRIGTFASILF